MINKNIKECEHNKCYFEPLTHEWYFETVEREYCDPDVRAYGIRYCPWCGKELPKDGTLLHLS